MLTWNEDRPMPLGRMMDTWPTSDDTEVIVVDDHSSDVALSRVHSTYFDMNHFLFVNLRASKKGAGAARNGGIGLACGKWLIFADADDYFLPDMKRIIDKYRDSDADLIYFHTACVNMTTGQEGARHHRFNAMLDAYTANPTEENLNALRYGFTPPWSKMIKRDLIMCNEIRFDEVMASNETMFSILAAYHAKKILVAPETIYCVTENSFGLAKTISKEAWYACFDVALRANKFLRSVGMGKHQCCIPMQSFKASQYGLKDLFKIIGMLIKYRQNPLAGLRRKT